jgi:hypothetical protein
LSKGTGKEESTPGTWIAETLMALSRDMLDLIFTWWSKELQTQGGIAINIESTSTAWDQQNHRDKEGVPQHQASHLLGIAPELIVAAEAEESAAISVISII